jgi:DNA-binding NarL/FixJ family response regulator
MTQQDNGAGVSATEPVRVLIVDDQRVFAEALALGLETNPGIRCEGVVATAEDALERLTASRPQVVLMDMALPGASGIEATRQIKELYPDIRVILLTGHVRASAVAAAAAVGASGFLPKDAPFSDVMEAVLAPVTANFLIDSGLVATLFSRDEDVSAAEKGTTDRPRLTRREQEVLALLSEGMPATGVARNLGISLNTCRGHIKSILAKMGAHSQLEVVTAASHQRLDDAHQPPGGSGPSPRRSSGGR